MARVMAEFSIDGPRFKGWHDPAIRWNGWAVPAFPRAEAEKVIAWVHEGNKDLHPSEVGTRFEWDGDVLVKIDQDEHGEYRERIEPTRDGYGIGAMSWTWTEVEDEPELWEPTYT